MFNFNQRSATGLLLLVFPVLIQVPYGLLATNFRYPGILREPTDSILTSYAAGGLPLVWTWFSFALAILPLLVGIVLLPAALSAPPRSWLQAATPLGVASAVLQMLGLLRWVVLVPLLATDYADPSSTPAQRQSIALVFEAQHQLFGVLMGEYLGQTLLALWTAGVALSVEDRLRQRPLGLAAAALFLLGSGDSLRMVLPIPAVFAPLPIIAFAVWSLWCVLLGWIVLWPAPPILARRQPGPAPEVAMEHAGFGESQ